MRCRKIQKNLSAYMAGELAQRETERVREHLSACPGCVRELAELKQLHKRLERLEEISPSPGFEAQFWRRVKETKQAKVPEPSRQWLPGPVCRLAILK
jgi:anti-sigma factor RsiW